MSNVIGIASTWTKTTLGRFCGERGKSIDPSKEPETTFELYSIPSFPIGQPEIVSGKDIGSNKQLVEPRTVLLGKINPRINRAWVVGDFTEHAKLASTEWLLFPPSSDIEPDFLRYFLQQNQVRDFLAANASGVGGSLMRVKSSTLRDFPFAYPSRDKQREIVAEIEKQFTRLEAGVAGLRRVQANLKRYQATVLKAACEGKLVPTEAELARQEGRTYETGAQLLERILTERRRKWNGQGKYKEPEKPDTTNLPTLPRGWSVAGIDQLSCHITSGSRDWSQFYGKGSGTFILAQNVRPLHLDLSERQTVDAPQGDAETERTRVAVNDLLVTIVGAKTGDVCRVPLELTDHYVCQSVALVRPVQATCARFAELYLGSQENGQAQWKRYIYGQGRPHLSFEQLRMTAILLPPYAEQQRIVAEVERRLSVVEEIEAVVKANLQRASRLRQSILQSAFEGRLVPDDMTTSVKAG